MLDLAQHALAEAGFLVARIDGQKSLLERARAISRFGENPGCTVMLATIGSAGEGCVAPLPSHTNQPSHRLLANILAEQN